MAGRTASAAVARIAGKRIRAISVIFLLGGSLLYTLGSGRKISLVKSGQEVKIPVQESTEEVKEPSTVQQTLTSKESRRDRRLRQIKKNQRQRRR